MGFATLRSGGTGRDRAFARALCFGDSTPLADFLRCLSDAARNVTAGCGTSRLAGIWTDGCFVAYGTADTGASSPSVDAFRSRAIISLGSDATRATNASESDLRRLAAVARSLAPRAAANGAQKLATADATAVASNYAWRSTVRVLAQCARDRAPAECLRCLQGSASYRTENEVVKSTSSGSSVGSGGFFYFLRLDLGVRPIFLQKRLPPSFPDHPLLLRPTPSSSSSRRPLSSTAPTNYTSPPPSHTLSLARDIATLSFSCVAGALSLSRVAAPSSSHAHRGGAKILDFPLDLSWWRWPGGAQVVVVAGGDPVLLVMEFQSGGGAPSELELKIGILLRICRGGGGGGTAELK
ncbi:hypothetical protein ACQ4PT_033260 [Festuca glaucescens]